MASAATRRLAVVLFNLGGPDSPAAVKPFLFNLFNDPAIIKAPGPVRWTLAKFISARRAPVARAIYDKIGGRSPIVPLTKQQAETLESQLTEADEWGEVKVFVTMRYWHPRAADVAKEVAEFAPTQVVLLPLYPQFSTTTTASSLKEWNEAAQAAGLTAPSASICCHPVEKHFLEAHRELLEDAIHSIDGPVRVLFSAHGLPQKIAESGDPYAWQVEATSSALAETLGLEDWQICYQSRVGRLEWIGPSTEDEIVRAGTENKSLVVVPIAFVSDHSETLVELDIEYRKLAESCGVPTYARVAALGTNNKYMEALAGMTLAAARRGEGVKPGGAPGGSSERLCPYDYGHCPMSAIQEG